MLAAQRRLGMPGRQMASRGGIIDASATSQFMSLSRQVKTALDETRLLMLGAQVLFGFKLNGVFQEEFANLSVASRYVDCAGQVLMAMAIGLLVAPSMQHRIVENGEDTVRIHRVTGVFAGMALLPFAVSLGLGFYIVFDHVFGATAAFVAGSAFCLLAGIFWYGLGFSLRPKSRERTMQEEKPTPLTTKIEQMLTEARIILPGAQALLGFQLTVTLTRAFGQLSDSLKLFHVASLCCVAVAIILLMTPAALHRISFAGEDTPSFFTIGSWFVLLASAPLAIGTVTLADGSSVKGFVAEPRALTGAEDITALGGWRAYIAQKVA